MIVGLIGYLLSSSACFGLTTVITPEMSDQARQKQEQIMQENQNRLKYDERLRQEQSQPQEKPQVYPDLIVPAGVDENAPSFNIDTIVIKDATHMNADTQTRFVASYLHKKLSFN